MQTIEYVFVAAGLAVAGGTLAKPYGENAGALELVLALLGLAAWWWAAWNYDDWLLDTANRGPEKWIPGVVGNLLMVEGMRRNCGLSITLPVIVFLVYGVVGHWLPGALEATESPPRRYVLYLYSDANAVPGIVMRVGATIVLAFILMGKVMEISGASRFFTDGALAAMGARRCWPAKVAIVSGGVLAHAVEGVGRKGWAGLATGGGLFAAAIGIGGATIWLGPENPAALIPALLALAAWVVYNIRMQTKQKARS